MKKYQKTALLEVVERTQCGGYLVQNEGDPSDRWVIPQETFESTYKEKVTKELTSNPQIENNFKYHAPKEGQVDKYTDIRDVAKSFALIIDELCPNSREKSLAITKLEEAVMWANASIARN